MTVVRIHAGLLWAGSLIAALAWMSLMSRVPPLLVWQSESVVVHLRPPMEDLLYICLQGVAALLATVAVGTAISILLRRNWFFGIGAILATVGCCCVAYLAALLLAPPTLTTLQVTSAPDAATYRLLRRNEFWADTLFLERVEREGPVFSRGALLGSETYGLRDEGPSVQIVRPAGLLARGHRHMYVSADGLILAGWEGTIHFVYDSSSGHFVDRRQIVDLSPFVLVGPDDALNEDDARRLAHAVAARRGGAYRSSPYPSDEVLREALRHPNARARELAARLAAA